MLRLLPLHLTYPPRLNSKFDEMGRIRQFNEFTDYIDVWIDIPLSSVVLKTTWAEFLMSNFSK